MPILVIPNTLPFREKVQPLMPALLLIALSVLTYAGVLPTFYVRPSESGITSLALYHFTHANIFHLMANSIAILAFKPRWRTIFIGWLSASLGGLSALTGAEMASCGLSGLACACFARRYAAYHKNILPFILANLLFAFIPNFSCRIHICSFLIAYTAWTLSYTTRTNG